MSEKELAARCEIAIAFLNDYINRPLHLRYCGPQNSAEWLRSIGFYDDGAVIPNQMHNLWREALGMQTVPKEYRYYHNGQPLPLGVRTMNDIQFSEYERLLKQLP